jgi:hypothetical protein
MTPDNLTKRGTVRKRKPKQPIVYFTQDTENAILQYTASTDDIFRNKIFNEKINYAFHELAENIIHTFKFYYTDVDSINELKHEVVCFLLEKLYLYKPEKGKAYSYFGTIAKRYLILYNEKNYKKLKDKANLDEVDFDDDIYSELLEESKLTEDLKKSKNQDLVNFFNLYIAHIDTNFDKLFPKDNDAKIADSILEVFKRRNNIEILEKKAIYIYIREISNIETPQITRVIKKLKQIYYQLYNEYYKYGEIKNLS